jgi:hypothetical protein
MVRRCFQDADVLELVRKQWRSPAPLLTISDRYGNTIHLVREPARTYTYLASPFESAIGLDPAAPAEIRPDDRLTQLVDRVLESVASYRDVLLTIRIPAYFFTRHPFALLEPFLLRGFEVTVPIWERLVDLRVDRAELLARCETTARRRIRHGTRVSGKWEVFFGEPVAETVMTEFYEACRQTRAAGGSHLKHPKDLYLTDRRRLVQDGKAALGIVRHDGFTGYLYVLVSEELAFYLDGAWTGTRSPFGNHLLHYQMMLFLKELDCARYSLGYVFPDLRSSSTKVANMARFKHSLGIDLSPVFMVTYHRQSAVGRLMAHARESRFAPLLRALVRKTANR